MDGVETPGSGVSAATMGVGFAAGASTAAVGLTLFCCRSTRLRARDREPLAGTAAAAPAAAAAAAAVLPPRELTPRAFLLAGSLSAILGSAAVYMGLFAGQSTSASIPSAVVSMSILRQLGGSNLLEKNLVQTGASSGQSVSAGLIFTLPALIMLDARHLLGWQTFDYLQTTLICIAGGTLGICFSILIRRTLLEMRPPLRFPEAVACAQVLRAGHSAGGGQALSALLAGGGLAALTKLAAGGLFLFDDIIGSAFFVGSEGAAIKLHALKASPALYGIGFIVGLQTATAVLLGGLTTWIAAVPISAVAMGGETADALAWAAPGAPGEGGAPAYTAAAVANHAFASRARFVAIGMMLSGTLFTFVKLSRPLARAAATARGEERRSASIRPVRERDADLRTVVSSIALMLIPVGVLFAHWSTAWMALPMAPLLVVVGFVMSGIAAYLAGLLGFSNSPISGVTVITILATASLLLLMGIDRARGPAAAVVMASVVACAAAIAGDSMQDLKTGELVGATPWKQQLMQSVGVVATSFVFAPVLNLMRTAYGFGPPTDEQPHSLAAPQAAMMASVAEGLFKGDLPFDCIAIGAALAFGVLALNLALARYGIQFQVPIMAFAVGAYLPLENATTGFLGACVGYGCTRAAAAAAAAERRSRLHKQENPTLPTEAVQEGGNGNEGEGPGEGDDEELRARLAAASEMSGATLFAGGLVTGESLMGVLLAIPIVTSGDPQVFRLVQTPHLWPAALVISALVAAHCWFARRDRRQLSSLLAAARREEL